MKTLLSLYQIKKGLILLELLLIFLLGTLIFLLWPVHRNFWWVILALVGLGGVLGNILLLRKVRSLEVEAKTQEHSGYLEILASGLVHEIKNPLNAMYVNSQLLEEELNNLKNGHKVGLLELASSIKNEIRRLEEILSEFLRYAKPGKMNFLTKDIITILEEIIRFFEADLVQKKIAVVKKFRANPLRIEVDEKQFKQAIFNLILNATQAMEGGGELTIGTEKADNRVKIFITDTGCGIKKEDLNKLFALFYSTKKGGTGLGLAIVKRIIEEHQGEIKVESEEGKGTSFTVTLPLRQKRS